MVMKLQRAGVTAPAEAGERKVPAGWGNPNAQATAAAPAEVAQTAAASTHNSASPPAEERKAPAGWGRPAGAAPAPQTAEQEQRAEIREKLSPVLVDTVEFTPELSTARDEVEEKSAFSANVIALKAQLEGAPHVVNAETGDVEHLDTAAENPLPEPQTAARARRNSGSKAEASVSSSLSLEDIRSVVRDALNDPPSTSLHEAEQTTNMLATLVLAAKDAANVVATLYSVNDAAAAEAHTLLFGAIEKRLQELGYAEAA